MQLCSLIGASVRASVKPRCKLELATSSPWRHLSSAPDFAAQVAGKKFQIYISKVNDPCVNLSIEHYLLQKSRKDSVVLFLYVNRPCIVIGRNQNPWLEIDLQLVSELKGGRRKVALHKYATRAQHTGKRVANNIPGVDIVRRRSGGGTVFHDEGNVNYCVICPSTEFTRDKHAEMVVRAIREGLSPRARVNERHDIVLDQGTLPEGEADPEDMHKTAYDDPKRTPLKISGSAYKMVRDRALHHGTCLLNSANMDILSRLFMSPARPYIKALGVESVRSSVGVIFPEWERDAVKRFQANVIKQFSKLYSVEPEPGSTSGRRNKAKEEAVELDLAHADLPEIQRGIDELRSDAWTYGQTPRFTFDNHAITVPTSRPSRVTKAAVIWPSPLNFPKPSVQLSVRQGVLEEATVASQRQDRLIGKRLCEIDDFENQVGVERYLHEGLYYSTEVRRYAEKWLNATFAKGAKKYSQLRG